VPVVPPRDFLDETVVPWYLLQQYLWSEQVDLATVDFDQVIEARLACPPMPPFLADQGVGW